MEKRSSYEWIILNAPIEQPEGLRDVIRTEGKYTKQEISQ
jgi:hypothetical protein